jgi:hypothetical protein
VPLGTRSAVGWPFLFTTTGSWRYADGVHCFIRSLDTTPTLGLPELEAPSRVMSAHQVCVRVKLQVSLSAPQSWSTSNGGPQIWEGTACGGECNESESFCFDNKNGKRDF